jgi:hypothetical protein
MKGSETMNRTLLTLGVLVGLGIGGGAWVSAQTAPAPKGQTHDHAAAAKGASPAQGGTGMGMMGDGHMCGGMGMGMMGGGMGMGGGMPMGGMSMMGGMMGGDARVEVKNVDKGVTITITSADPAKVKRLQKMAEAMRLMHEANMP